jgi:hypothetical protein
LMPSTKLVVSASTIPTFPLSIGDTSPITTALSRTRSSQTKCMQSKPLNQLIFADHMIDTPLYSSWYHEHMHCPTQWPPPYLYLRWCDRSKPWPIPWPSFHVL